jgi:hypothetical protein
MVIIVPALSTTQDRQNEAVLASIVGCVPDFAEHVA